MTDILSSAQRFATGYYIYGIERPWNEGTTVRQGTVGGVPRQGLTIDCSNLLYQSLLGAGYNVKYLATAQMFDQRGNLTSAGANYYNKVDARTVKPGDIVMFSGHVGVVVAFNPDTGRGMFFGSQGSTGPAEVAFSTNPDTPGIYWGGTTSKGSKEFLGFLSVSAPYDPIAAAAKLAPIEAARAPALDQLGVQPPQSPAKELLDGLTQSGPPSVATIPSEQVLIENVPLPRPRPPEAGYEPGTSYHFNDSLDQIQKSRIRRSDGSEPSQDAPVIVPVRYGDGGTALFRVTGVGADYIYGEIEVYSPFNVLETVFRQDASGYSTTVYSADGRQTYQTVWDAQGRLTQEKTWTGTGSSTIIYDTSSHDWSEIKIVRDLQGNIVSSNADYDNGSSRSIATDLTTNVITETTRDELGTVVRTVDQGQSTTVQFGRDGSKQWTFVEHANGSGIFTFEGGAQFTFDAGQINGISFDGQKLTIDIGPSSGGGLSRELHIDLAEKTAVVEVGGERGISVASNGQVHISGNSIVATTRESGWTATYDIGSALPSVTWGSADGTTKFKFDFDVLTGKLRPSSAIYDGQAFSNIVSPEWLTSAISGANAQDISAALANAANQLAANQSAINSGNTPALSGDVAALVELSKVMDGASQTTGYLGDRLANGSVSNTWVGHFIGPPPGATTLPVNYALINTFDPALAQAQANWMNIVMRPALPPSIIIIEVLGFGYDSPFMSPLVLDLDGNGIDLVSRDQSSADFDIDSNGTRERVSWVGRADGILVFDRNGNGQIDNATEWFGEQFSRNDTSPPIDQKGFSALATLAVTGAAVFSAGTSLINAATGRLYFDDVQVWVDANQNGVNDAGELRSLAELGITSIDLTSTDINRVVNGNLIVATSNYTTDDGTRHIISDIGFTDKPGATQQAPGMSAATLAFAEFVSKGLAAQASGQAQAASAAMAALPIGFAAEIAAMQSRMVERRVMINGQSGAFDASVADYTQVNFLGWPGANPLTARRGTPLPVPQQVMAALNAISAAMTAVRSAADGVASGTSAIAGAQAAGLAADLDPSAVRISDATTKATQSSAAWGSSIALLMNANNALIAAGNLINTATALLAQVVPSNYNTTGNVANGASYANPYDAWLASESFAALESGLKSFAAAKDAMQKLLGALGLSGNYGTVLFGGNGSSQTAGNDRTLFMAGAGSQTFVSGASHDDFMLTPSAGAVTIHNFASGTNGDTLQLLNVGHVVVGDNGQGGTLLSYGAGQSVNLVGVTPGQLDLLANVVGVDTISFAATQTAGTRSLQGAPVFYDGQIHIRNIVGSDRGDTLIGDQGANKLIGGSGNDTLMGHGGGDILDGRGGINTASYAWSSSGVGVDLVTGKDTSGDQLYNINNVIGSKGADIITGDGANNVIDGGAGDDLITGGGGNDVYLFGRGSGRDIIVNGVSLNGVPSGKLKLSADVAADELWFERSGNDLVIRLLGRTDSATIRGWFSHDYSQLRAIALASGLEIGTAAINSAIATFAAYRAAHSDFNPATATTLPGVISIASQFVTPTDVPGVPQASNVALATEQAYQTGAAAQAASTMASWSSSLSGSYGSLVGAENSANSWMYAGKVPNTPFGQSGQRAYLIQTAQYPGTTFLVVGTYGPQSTWTWYQEISSLTSTTFYIKKTVTFNVSQVLVSANWHPEWVAGDMPWDGNSMIDAASAISQTRALLGIAPAVTQAISAAGSARNAALGAAVVANRASAAWTSTEAVAARNAAQVSESAFAVAIANYLALSNNVGSAAYLVNVNQGRLNGIMPASYTHTVTGYSRGNPITIVANINYSFYSATDQAQFNALQAEQAAASGMVSSVYAALAASLGAIGATAGYSSARIAGISENLVAGGLGDFLVAGGAGAHVLVGGAGRDLFAFGSWNDTSTSSLQAFQAGLQGDRLLVVPAGSRTIFVNNDAGGSTLMSYQIASGAYAQLQFTGTSLGALSLYDNIVGVETVSFANMSRGVSVSLASVTPRDYDGWTHVRNLTGSAYGDTLTGDQQNNIIIGGAGNDVLAGGAGDDMIYGGDGNDRILLEGQNDIASGGAGADTFVMTRDPSFSFGNGLKNLIVDFSPADGDKIDLSDFATASSFENLAYEIIQVDGLSSLRLYMGSNPAGQYVVLKGVTRSDLSHANFVYPPNQPPVAHDDAIVANGAGPRIISAASLLANDTDPDVNDGKSLLSVSALSAKGASVRLENGNVIYDPSSGSALLALVEGQTTTDTFTYTMRDSAGATSTATVTVTFTGANDAPTAVDDAMSASEDGGAAAIAASELVANDFDVDLGDSMTLVSVASVSSRGGTIRWADGTVTYDPGALFQSLGAGQTLVDTFTYTIRDTAGLTSTATVRVTVSGQNDVPVAVADSVTTSDHGVLSIAPSDLLANDTDVDVGDHLSIGSVSAMSAKGATIALQNGVITYDPADLFRYLREGEQTTDTFSYDVRDASGAMSTATVTVTINGTNDAPVAQNDALVVAEDGVLEITTASLLANDLDAEGDALMLVSIGNAQHGTVSLDQGVVRFVPDANYNGPASFTYTVSDGHGGVSTATAIINVTSVQDAPVAVADHFEVRAGTPLQVSVATLLSNDFDVDGDALNVESVGNPVNGTVSFQNGKVLFTAEPGFEGIATFDYTVSDGNGGYATGQVTINVTGNSPPVLSGAPAQLEAALVGATYIVQSDDLLQGWTDADGDVLAIANLSADHGAVTDNGDGTFTVTLEAGYIGNVAISYSIADGRGGVTAAVRTFEVKEEPAVTGEFLVNTTTDNAQTGPSVVTLSGGNFVVVWQIFAAGGGAYGADIYGQMFNAAGQRIGAEFVVNSIRPGAQTVPDIVALADGGFVVAWQSFDNPGDGTGPNIKSRVFSANGNAVGPESLVNTYTNGSQVMPAIGSLTNGGYVVVWQDASGTLGDTVPNAIKAQLYDSVGGKTGSEFLVNTQTAGSQLTPDVVGLSNGGFVVVWQDAGSFSLGDSSASIKAQVFTANGAKVGFEFLVNTATANAQSVPSVTALVNGNFVVTWQDASGTLGDPDGSIKGQIFNPSGVKVGSEFLVNTATSGLQTAPTITSLVGGGFVITWSDPSGTLGDNSSTSIKAQVFNSAGTKLGVEFLVNMEGAGAQTLPTIAALNDGGFVISWTDASGTMGDASSTSIKARTFPGSQLHAFAFSSGQNRQAEAITEEASLAAMLAVNNSAFSAFGQQLLGWQTGEKALVQQTAAGDGWQIGDSVSQDSVARLVDAMATFDPRYGNASNGMVADQINAAAGGSIDIAALAVPGSWHQAA